MLITITFSAANRDSTPGVVVVVVGGGGGTLNISWHIDSTQASALYPPKISGLKGYPQKILGILCIPKKYLKF